METKYIRTRNTWLAYVLLALYGYFLNILGPITPFLKDEFQLSYTVSSLHFSAFAVGILVIGLTGHYIIERTGRWRALAIGALGLGTGALLLVAGRGPVVTVGASFLMGWIGSFILAVVPAALSEEHQTLRAVAISEANVISSIVSTIAPVLVGWLVGMLINWRVALIVAAVLAILLGGFLLRVAPARPVQQTTKGVTKNSLPFMYWYYWVALILAVSIEFCMISWSADYVERELHIARASAAQAVSLFLGGMIVGRFVTSRVLRSFSSRTVVIASLLIGLAGFMLFWSAIHPVLGMAGLAVAGLGVAGLYPVIISMAIGESNGNEAQAGARATLASGFGILILPLILGRLADLAGLKSAYGVVAVLFVTTLVMIGISPKFKPATSTPPIVLPDIRQK